MTIINNNTEHHPANLIEIPSVSLLDKNQCPQNQALIEALKKLAHSLGLEFGWHYLLDLSWIIQQLIAHSGTLPGKRIMDAGAGTGILQWYLAQEGAEVISVDRSSRALLPLRFRARFNVQGLRQSDLLLPSQVIQDNLSRRLAGPFYRQWLVKLASLARDTISLTQKPHSLGHVLVYNQDLANLADIQDNSLDAVVAVSALEHNSPEGLAKVVKEIMRVLKPGGVLLATLCAARDQDLWHEPSSGWCYTDASLRRLFELPDETPSNYSQYDQLFSDLHNCAELRDNLASFYFRSDKNGMPWGKWGPQYQPVGVCKVKG